MMIKPPNRKSSCASGLSYSPVASSLPSTTSGSARQFRISLPCLVPLSSRLFSSRRVCVHRAARSRPKSHFSEISRSLLSHHPPVLRLTGQPTLLLKRVHVRGKDCCSVPSAAAVPARKPAPVYLRCRGRGGESVFHAASLTVHSLRRV